MYLADAVFTVALGGDVAVLEELSQAVRSPRWPLFLGRRSCPPNLPILLGVSEGMDVREALAREPWHASERQRHRSDFPKLEVICDGREGEACEFRQDVPLSFGAHRRYAARPIVRLWVPNPDVPAEAAGAGESIATPSTDHDPMGYF